MLKIKQAISLLLFCLTATYITVSFSGCGGGDKKLPDFDYADIILAEQITSTDKTVIIDENSVTITRPGYYRISGTLENGRIIVDSTKDSGDVYILLNGIDISCSDASPFSVVSAHNVRLSLNDNTVNTITDNRPSGDYEDSAALFSKDDLFIDGGGKLSVKSSCDGISSRDDIVISDGIIAVESLGHSIKGKDSLLISGGTITVDSEADGLKSTNDSEESKGYVEISGGIITINALDDGIYAVSNINVTGGKINITTENNGIKCDGSAVISGATITIITQDDGIVSPSISGDGSAMITVNGETLDISK